MDYTLIKSLAAFMGVSYRELIALAPQNDPFYVGTPNDVAMGEWFADCWRRAGYSSGVHLRRVHYWCVSQPNMRRHDGQPYENTDAAWKYVCQAAKVARYLGLVQIGDIADNKNPDAHINANYSDRETEWRLDVPELDDPKVWIWGLQNSLAQPYHLEVWCEKSTMNDVLLPVCAQYGANLATFEGEVSVTACYDVARRIERADKPARIFYISDFDPAGQSMPVATARKIEYMLARYDIEANVRLKPIALTSSQVRRYRLPRTPIKESEKRADKFEGVYGSGAVELDALEALHPGVLEGVVVGHLKNYYSHEAARAALAKKSELQEAVSQQVQAIMKDYAVHIDALRDMNERLEMVTVDVAEYGIDPFPAVANENENDFLFDSGREYVEQIGYYKAFKAGEL